MKKVVLKERYKEAMFIIGTAVVCLTLSHGMVLKPSFQRIQSLQNALQIFQQKVLLYDEIVRLKRQVVKSEALLGLLADRPAIMAKISNVASKNQVKVQGVIPKTETMKGYAMLWMEMDFRSSFFNLLRYLRNLENLIPAVNVMDFDLSLLSSGYSNLEQASERATGKNILQGKIKLGVLLKQSAA